MPKIFETDKFEVVGRDKPHHDRNNGGHAVVSPKDIYKDRIEMPMNLYLEMMQLVVVAGGAITTTMKEKGIDVVRINYQDNGNWPYFEKSDLKLNCHVHLYVRSMNEKHPDDDPRFKPFPNALFFPYMEENPEYYQNFKPYTNQDCVDIKAEMERLLDTEKYPLIDFY